MTSMKKAIILGTYIYLKTKNKKTYQYDQADPSRLEQANQSMSKAIRVEQTRYGEIRSGKAKYRITKVESRPFLYDNFSRV